MTREQWHDHAACRDHPELDAEAWSGVVQSLPQREGAEALIVCRYVCPVAFWCRQYYQGVGMVAGGGWWDGKGKFQDGDGLLDVHQAAAYIGVPVARIQAWLGDKLHSVGPAKKKAWFRIEEVRKLARLYGPRHGTNAARRLHVIRGEQLCPDCTRLVRYQEKFRAEQTQELVAAGRD